MSDQTTAADSSATTTKPRAATVRAYLLSPTLISFRVKGVEFAQQDMTQVPPEQLMRLACEGAIATYDGPMPDRTPPAEKTTREKHDRAPTMRMQAIATVKAGEFTRQAKANGAKPDKAAIAERAMQWVRSLTAEQHAKLAKAEPVAIEMARLKGTKVTTLDDLLAPEANEAALFDEDNGADTILADPDQLPVAAE